MALGTRRRSKSSADAEEDGSPGHPVTDSPDWVAITRKSRVVLRRIDRRSAGSESREMEQSSRDLQEQKRWRERVSTTEMAAALDAYNTWRRGGDGAQPDPTALGLLIETAAERLRSIPIVKENPGNIGSEYQITAGRRIAQLEREVAHWKANHATEVRRARILKERTDMPIERIAAYEQWGNDLAALEELRMQTFSAVGMKKHNQLLSEGYEQCGIAMQRIAQDGAVIRAWVGAHGMILWPRTECEAGVERAEMALRSKPPRFPVELRKMWSGSEVQEWLNEHFAK